MKAGPDPGQHGDKADQRGGDQHGPEAAGQKKGDGSGRDQQADGKDKADRGQGGDDGQGQNGQEAIVQHLRRQARHLCLGGVEGMQHQVAPFQHQDQGDRNGDGGGGDQIALPHPQHVAKQDVVKVDIGRKGGVQHDPQREHGRKDHAHHGVAFQPAVVGKIAGQER